MIFECKTYPLTTTVVNGHSTLIYFGLPSHYVTHWRDKNSTTLLPPLFTLCGGSV